MNSMSATSDYRVENSVIETTIDAADNYKAFRFFLTLAAAFSDVDERAIRRPKNTINRIIGRPFAG